MLEVIGGLIPVLLCNSAIMRKPMAKDCRIGKTHVPPCILRGAGRRLIAGIWAVAIMVLRFALLSPHPGILIWCRQACADDELFRTGRIDPPTARVSSYGAVCYMGTRNPDFGNLARSSVETMK